ncbi:hypothetical protein CVU75_02690 [Candidatus Dependentiae bacterium HGW-Dependentiae-1]|nr:MAG: hypothetical protein CVU75_02690 [Candidatus Dependentiae bacterium HGW-Dependentiae-1]
MAKKLSDLVAALVHHTHDWKITLLRSWPDIVGPLCSKVSVEKITEDTMLLVVQDSCWLQELYLLSPVLLKTINKTLDAPRIKNLRFRVASSAVKKEKKRNVEIKKQPLKKVYLNPTEEAALKKIGDQELTHALRQFLVRCYQER